MIHRPGLRALLLALALASGLAVGVYRVPAQVSDSLEIVETMAREPSAPAAFLHALRTSDSMLRPMRQYQS